MNKLRELVCFRLQRGLFAVDISTVREIVRPQRTTRVPKSPVHVLGVTNLRGHVIPVLDLRLKLGMQQREQNTLCRTLVMEIAGALVGFAVDEVTGIVRLPWDVIEPVDALGALKGSELISGVARHGDELICLLDLRGVAESGASLALMSVIPDWQEPEPAAQSSVVPLKKAA
ncbi:chemotaxis protein CheW [Desulfovibrio ferrophilus]|uniref:chemotaxis protein CheW n=1 Tax=Desulfovibrio ferrophilus TaxID=241368 RepID=UPI00156220BC|nr:chemotaxis protein CheW [Desulfovibrio ferrophilus]